MGGLFIIYMLLLWGMLETRPSDERAVVSQHLLTMSWSQIWPSEIQHESAKSGTVMLVGQDSPLLLA